MREEERRETVPTDVPGLGDPLAPKEENPRHPPKMPSPNPPSQDNPQVETAKMEAPKKTVPMDVPTTASSSESATTTMDLNLMKAKPDPAGEVTKEEPSLPAFILAPAFMDIVCPECGALLQGASPTNLKNRQLQHPFGDPPLGGVPCRFKGKLFKTPLVRIDLL